MISELSLNPHQSKEIPTMMKRGQRETKAAYFIGVCMWMHILYTLYCISKERGGGRIPFFTLHLSRNNFGVMISANYPIFFSHHISSFAFSTHSTLYYSFCFYILPHSLILVKDYSLWWSFLRPTQSVVLKL